ncbi:MAG: histidine phosphatase family protein [Proteobacteria bacterium]|nr:histidine phosphatase family protein [Pseudomonadota bacterium]
MTRYGDATRALIEAVFDAGVDHVAALVRHSAREFEPGRHDLLNPLTDEGRDLARSFGALLPKELLVRGYTSPAERCVETIQLVLHGHGDSGGQVTRYRPIEALGVFYVLDQMKMYRAMTAASGQIPFLASWFADAVPADVMMPADLAAKLVGRVVAAKLEAPIQRPQLEVCVSHDMSLYLVRDRLLGLGVASAGAVDFLDGVVFYEQHGHLWMRGLHAPAQQIDLAI